MTERASVAQVVQIGVESVAGTAVAANKRLASMSIEPSPAGDVTMQRPMGQLWNTVAVTGREWSTARVSGEASYNEILYALCSVLKKVTPTTPGGATLARQWLFDGSPVVGADVPQTYTIERGDAANAYKIAYGLFTAFNMPFNRQNVTLGGTMIGQKFATGVTLTASPTQLNIVPVSGHDINVYIDDTALGLGTSQALRVFEGEWSIGNRYNTIWPLNRAVPSFAAHVAIVPSMQLTFRAMRDATTDLLYATLAGNASKFIRIEMNGPIIEDTTPYAIVIDMAGKLSAVPGFSVTDEVDSYDFTFSAVTDGTWAKPYSVKVITDVTAL